MPMPSESVVSSELEECNHYVRHIFGIFVSWYTFFVTVNAVVGGWFVSRLIEKKSISPLLFLTAVGLFLISNCLAIAFTHVFMKSLHTLHLRASALTRELFGASGQSELLLPAPVMPISVYTWATMAFRISMYLMIVIWIAGGVTGWIQIGPP